MNWKSIFAAILQTEEAIVPIFVHNANSQKIAGVIMAVESAVPDIVASVQSSAPAPAAPQT